MKLLKVLVVLLVIAVAVGGLSSTEYSIERSITIQAPPEAVHAYVGDLTRWPSWAPWDEQHDDIQTTYGDKTTGVGAHQSWTSAEGSGELTFTRCDVQTGIAYDMAFIMDEDTRVPAHSAMTYKPAAGGGTEVVWSMSGDWKGATPPIVDGWMQILSPLFLGGMFDDGLTKLKTVVEGQPG